MSIEDKIEALTIAIEILTNALVSAPTNPKEEPKAETKEEPKAETKEEPKAETTKAKATRAKTPKAKTPKAKAAVTLEEVRAALIKLAGHNKVGGPGVKKYLAEWGQPVDITTIKKTDYETVITNAVTALANLASKGAV